MLWEIKAAIVAHGIAYFPPEMFEAQNKFMRRFGGNRAPFIAPRFGGRFAVIHLHGRSPKTWKKAAKHLERVFGQKRQLHK